MYLSYAGVYVSIHVCRSACTHILELICMHVCKYIYMNTDTHRCCMHVNTSVGRHTLMCMDMCVNMCMCVCMYESMHVSNQACMGVCMYICVYICGRLHRDARWIGGLSHQSSNLSCLCNLLQKVVVHACSDTRFKRHKVVNYPANLQTT